MAFDSTTSNHMAVTVYSAINVNQTINANIIELNARTNSNILFVTVYGSRVEIVRVFKFDATPGYNVVSIEDLLDIISNSLQ